jgi:hypothetical protein
MSAMRDGTIKTPADQDAAKATQEKSAEGSPGQEAPRHTDKRASTYTTRSHKSVSRLTGSPLRPDSAAQIYHRCHATVGQSHE